MRIRPVPLAALATLLLLARCQVIRTARDAGRPGSLSLAEIKARLAAPGALESYVPQAPLGLPEDLAEFIPADNPMTPAKVELGRQLFFDPRLSRDGTVTCASCHAPQKGWTDQAPVSTGIGGQKGGRSAPSVVNRIFGRSQFWDGRAASLEEQALGPIGNPVEMGFSPAGAAERLNTIPGYQLQFEAVFGGPATPGRIAKAIAAFERTVMSGAAPYDYYERAKPWFDWDPEEEEDEEFIEVGRRILAEEQAHPMSTAALRGRDLFFGKAQCATCHLGHDFTDEQFHNIGAGTGGAGADAGLMNRTGREEDRGKFKTPGLRNVAETAPYMHAGSLKTLREVVQHYNQGGVASPDLSANIFPLGLTAAEIEDVIAFLEEGLSGETTRSPAPRLP